MGQSSFKEQLALLKIATMHTGAIHEAQALQLKMWPLLIPSVTKAEARVDTDKKMVTFLCKSKMKDKDMRKLAATENMRKTCAHVATWTQHLLWDDTTVIIHVNDKVIYDTRAK